MFLQPLSANTVTVNDRLERSDILNLIGKNGVNLREDIAARILTVDTGTSDITNARNIKGEEGVVLKAGNVTNDGNILSGGTVLINARGKVYNSATGLMSGKNVHVDAGMIENNRGKILSDGSLSLIAETLIRNDNGIVDSKDEMYLKVANGRLENIGTSEILIDYVKKQTGTQPETKKKTFGRRAVTVLDEAVQEQERVLNINMKDSVIRSGKNLYMDINGDVINSDGGKIVAGEELGIKANNVYNIGKYIQDVQNNELVSGAGGRIEAGKVFLEVKGKVVNGTEDYLTGAYRRGDGVLVDNRQVTSMSPSEIKGREVTKIDSGELINTSHIGGTGITIVDTERNLTNASMGNAIAVIDGKEVLVDGKGGVHNIGAEIRGNEVTQVLSEKGKVVNESTVKVEKTEAPVRPERVPSFFRVFRNDTPQEMRESIRNIGKIESNGTTYVKAKNEVINIAGNIKGKNGTYVGSESGNIEDRTVTLHYEGRNVVETKTEIREIPVMKRIKFREVPTGEVRKEEVTASTKWDHRKTTETVSGEIGDGADTVLEAGKDLILESSNIRGKDNIVLNAKNYILMLSTVNTDTKDRTETHKSGKKLGKRKTTTNSWYVDNEYVNGVDLTTDGNVVLNWDINGKKRGANKGIFAQGVNFNAKGQVGAYSDGNIYVQGTKDRIHEVFNSHTVKRFGGVKYGSKHDYVNSKIERYRHTQLYGEAGITLDSEGKLRVEGADVQSYGNVLLRGKQGVEILPGEEINSRYEEHTSKGIKASLNAGWNGISAGVGYQKTEDRISELTKNVISNNIQAGGDVEIRSEEGNITMGPTDGFIGGKLKLDGNDIDIIDAHSERIIDTVSKKTYIGVGVTAGIPVIGAAKQLIDAGRAIGKSKHREDYLNSGFGAFSAGMGAMNAFGNLFTSPMATSASLNYSKSQDSYHREERISVGSRLHVKGGVEYNGKNLHTVNLNMLNEGDTVYNITGNIIREAGKSTIKESTGSRGYGLSLAKGSDGMNPFKGNGTTVTAGTSGSKGKSEGVYYTNPKDETKGNSHYNVGGDVKDSGVDIKTGSISGKIEGNHTVESLQDTFDSRNRGYSISTGIGINSTKGNKGTTYNTNIQSVSAGYSQGKTVQRITREVSEFTAGSGMLEVKGETRQTGSLIDGGFTLNTGGYSKEDLHDVNKTRNVGINVTVYPNTVYSKRDKNGERVFVNGHNPKEKGVAVGIGISYTDIDKKRDVAATVGNGVNINHDISGVNRDPNRQTGEFEGREITGVDVNLGTEYWLTAAGRGKTRDIIEDAGETADGIRRMLTWKDENGNLRILESIETENLLRKFMQIGFVDTKGKTQKQVKEELEKRFGSLAKKGVSVNFYDGKDIKGSGLDENTLSKLLADGFAVTKDGTVWINKDHVDSGKLIDFNKVTQHEISHIVFGEDSEFQAQYLTKAYGEFLEDIEKNGYLQDGEGIIDYKLSMLSDEDTALLNSYNPWERQYTMESDIRALKAKQAKCQSYACVQDYSRRIHNLEIYYKKYQSNLIIKDSKDKRNRLQRNPKRTKKETDEIARLEKTINNEKMKDIGYTKKLHENSGNRESGKLRIVSQEYMDYTDYLYGKAKAKNPGIRSNPELNKDITNFRVEMLGISEDVYLVREYFVPDQYVGKRYVEARYKQNTHKGVTIDRARNVISGGNAVVSSGILLTGYGVTTELAEQNREMKRELGISGLMDAGTGAYRIGVGAAAVTTGLGGIGSCGPTLGMSCVGGTYLVVAGAGTAGFGANNIMTGGQKIGNALFSKGQPITGKAEDVYRRLVNNRASGVKPYNIINPIGMGIKAIGGTEELYEGLNMLSIAGAPTLQLQTALYAPIIGAANNFVNSSNPNINSKEQQQNGNLYSNISPAYSYGGISSNFRIGAAEMAYDTGYAERMNSGRYLGNVVYNPVSKAYSYGGISSNFRIGVADIEPIAVMSDLLRPMSQISNTVGNNIVNSTVKTPVTDAKVSEATKNLFKSNTNSTSETLMTPERYYNIRAKNIQLGYESQQAVIKNYGNIIESDHLITDPNYIYQKNSKVADFDFKHIIEGDTGRTISGAHKLGKNVQVVKIVKVPDKNGVYKAKVEVLNPTTNVWKEKGAETTMFPDDWSVDKTKWEINGAWNSRDFFTETTKRGIRWEGTSPSGVKIEGFLNKKGTRAFPKYEGGN